MVDQNLLVGIGALGVMFVGGVFAIRDSLRRSKEQQIKEVIEAIRNQVAPIQMAVDKNKDDFIVRISEKEKLINSMKGDLDSLYFQVNSLEKIVAEHKGILSLQNPLITELKKDINDLKVKIEVLGAQ
jgi:chromosome segregation ATPase